MTTTAARAIRARRSIWQLVRPVVRVAWPTPRRFLFILSHMRSGSSLLTHLLVNNPEVFGFGECHVPHTGPRSLREVSFKTTVRLHAMPAREAWVLDKILHNQLTIDNRLMRSEAGRFVFLLRNPEATLRSLLSLRRWVSDSDIRKPEHALEYYMTRLKGLRDLAAEIPSGRALLLHYEDLLECTADVLRTLEQHLALSSPLTEEYAVMRTTGRSSIGDPSPVIRSGKIRRDVRTSEVEVPDDVLRAAVFGYEETRTTLERLCLGVHRR